MLERGWSFDSSFPGATGDKLKLGGTHLRDIYHKVEPEYNARYTVPTFYDTKTNSIVNNESSEVIRFLNTGFNSLLPSGSAERELDLYPENLRKEIDEINEWVYNDVNNGVYKSGFATTQEAYEKNVKPLFAGLDKVLFIYLCISIPTFLLETDKPAINRLRNCSKEERSIWLENS